MFERAHFWRGLGQFHRDGIARKDRGAPPLKRRHRTLNRGIAFDLNGIPGAKRFQENVDRNLDFAPWLLPWAGCSRFTGGLRVPYFLAVLLERLAQAFEFKNQSLTLRAKAVARGFATTGLRRSVRG
jgi:hypothetical protein